VIIFKRSSGFRRVEHDELLQVGKDAAVVGRGAGLK